jgi:hypothetical protein
MGRASFSPEAGEMRQLILSLVVSAITVAGCAGDSGVASSSPTSPTPTTTQAGPQPQISLSGITSVPDGAGVQFNTDFQLTAAGSFSPDTEFVWNFGDGSSTTTSTPTVSRTFGQAGVFTVNVTARRSGESVSATRPVSVRSMVGHWVGKMTGFTNFPLHRPVPITSFDMLIVNQTRDNNTLMLHGRWMDDAGCRETRVEYFRQRIEPASTATVTFGVDELTCAKGAFYLSGTADATFDKVEGHCNVMGNNPNCRFTMVRE